MIERISSVLGEGQGQKVAVISLTEGGRRLAQNCRQAFEQVDLYVSTKVVKEDSEYYLPGERFSDALQQLFQTYDSLICIMATGIVVRSLAPVLDDKRYDPAVLVMDEKGQFVISLLSGHVGGANQLARELADYVGGQAVITTATDTQNVTALDLLAKEVSGYYAEFKEQTKLFNSLLANQRKVGLFQDEPWVNDFRGLILVESLAELPATLDGLIIVSTKRVSDKFSSSLPVVEVIPKRLVLGMGSRKDIPSQLVFEAFELFCELHQVKPQSIAKIVSIDLKKEEQGLLALAEKLGCPFETFSKEQLKEAASYYPSSDFVKKTVGIGNVACASVHYETDGQVLTERFSHQGVTIALGKN